MIEAMASKKIASDPTMVAFEGLYVAEMRRVARIRAVCRRAAAGHRARVPARRCFGPEGPDPKTLLAAMHRAKVPIVAGTAGFGLELVRELEIYVEAGLPPAEALATATIEPARLLKVEERTGSIAVGKAADLVLVEGDPSERIGDLRNTRVVMMDGKLMDADALRKAAGFTGRPRSVEPR